MSRSLGMNVLKSNTVFSFDPSSRKLIINLWLADLMK